MGNQSDYLIQILQNRILKTNKHLRCEFHKDKQFERWKPDKVSLNCTLAYSVKNSFCILKLL